MLQPLDLDIVKIRNGTTGLIPSAVLGEPAVHPCIAVQVTGTPCKNEAILNAFLHHSMVGYFGCVLPAKSFAAYEAKVPPAVLIDPSLPTDHVWTIIGTFFMKKEEVRIFGSALSEVWVNDFITKINEHLEAHKPATVTDCVIYDIQRYADYVAHLKNNYLQWKKNHSVAHV